MCDCECLTSTLLLDWPLLSGYSILRCYFSQACNPKHLDFAKTAPICSAENIDDSLTQYRWLVSAPAGPDGVTSPMREVDTDTFFTNTKSITLDPVYFQAGSRIQCAARAFNANGDAGLELSSPIAVISKEEGECMLEQTHTYAQL